MIDVIVKSFEEITRKPEQFVSSKNNLITDIRKTLKTTYDFSKKEETNTTNSDALPELIIENFDLEQIWQQLELQNDSILKRNIGLVSKLIVDKDNLVFNDEQDEESSDDNNEHLTEEENENFQESEEDQDDEGKMEEERSIREKFRTSVIDDNFFKLEEMNKFLLSEEKKIDNNKNPNAIDEGSESEDGSIDMFENNTEDESEEDADTYNNKKNPRYKDFFGTKTQQMEENNEEMEYREQDEENEFSDQTKNKENVGQNKNDTYTEEQNSNKVKSALELREERLKMKINQLERAAITDKPWQLKGEVLAENRPINSLLEEVLEYDVGNRPAPVITEATTMVLEDAIKQRIKNKAFDDVERKQKPVDTPLEYKKKLVLDQEKSKESLAQIYEKEFLEQQQVARGDNEDKEEEIPQLHKDITSIMNSLFCKLDALSNFHFTPKPVAPDIKIVSNLPAISMEEVAPVAMTDASLLAPEEVKAKIKGDVVGQNERTATDKNRERRKKKRKQKIHAKAKNVGIISKPGLGNKYSKEKVKRILDQVSKEKNVDKMVESYGSKGIRSSKAFFTQLQEEVTSQIKTKTKVQKRKGKDVHNAKRLKL